MATRISKVYSITMPPNLGREAERLAKKENRTMSELMREAFRRYQETASQSATMAEALQILRANAKGRGIDKLTKREIEAKIAEARREMAGNTVDRARK